MSATLSESLRVVKTGFGAPACILEGGSGALQSKNLPRQSHTFLEPGSRPDFEDAPQRSAALAALDDIKF